MHALISEASSPSTSKVRSASECDVAISIEPGSSWRSLARAKLLRTVGRAEPMHYGKHLAAAQRRRSQQQMARSYVPYQMSPEESHLVGPAADEVRRSPALVIASAPGSLAMARLVRSPPRAWSARSVWSSMSRAALDAVNEVSVATVRPLKEEIERMIIAAAEQAVPFSVLERLARSIGALHSFITSNTTALRKLAKKYDKRQAALALATPAEESPRGEGTAMALQLLRSSPCLYWLLPQLAEMQAALLGLAPAPKRALLEEIYLREARPAASLPTAPPSTVEATHRILLERRERGQHGGSPSHRPGGLYSPIGFAAAAGGGGGGEEGGGKGPKRRPMARSAQYVETAHGGTAWLAASSPQPRGG